MAAPDSSTPDAQPPSAAQPESRVARGLARRWRQRKRLAIAMLVAGGVIVLAIAWLVITGLLARSQLNAVRSEAHQLRAQISAGDLAGARKTLGQLRTHAHRAHVLATGPAWAVAAEIPAGGEPFETIRGLTAAVDSLATHSLPGLIDAREKLDPATLRNAAGAVNISAIASVAPTLAHADAVFDDATRSVQHLPGDTWLSPVDSARTDLLGQLQDVASTVHTADVAAQVLPTMLGGHGVQRYFVAFQNEAETRGTGGLPGAFGILQATNGRLAFTRFGNDSTLSSVPTGLQFGADFNRLYSAGEPTSLYVNSNLSPNFPYAAQIWTAMWQKFSGQTLNGAVAVDPTTLSYLLAVTGPTKTPDGTQVDSGDVVALTQSTVYERFANDTAGRKNFLLDVARAASRHIIDTSGSTKELVKAAGHAADERRLMVWSAQPSIEARIATTHISGAVERTSNPYAGLALVNAGGNKLDYYLDASLSWQRTGCGSNRSVTVTITLHNDAPTGLPAYVTARGDAHLNKVEPGDNRLILTYLATNGATFSSSRLNGKRTNVAVARELGHPVFYYDLELPRGATQTIVLHLDEPAGQGAVTVLPQPLVRPLKVSVGDAAC